MATTQLWSDGDRMRALEVVTEIRGWKAGKSDDAIRQHFLMWKAADEVERLVKMLDTYAALRKA